MKTPEHQNKWVRELISPGTIITLTMVLLTFIGQWYTLGSRTTTNEADIKTLTKKADAYDLKFERMPKDYVLRTELQDMLMSIREDERDIKMDLRSLGKGYR